MANKTITEIIMDLGFLGIRLLPSPSGEHLQVFAPEGVLNLGLRSVIEHHKRAIIENRKRYRFILDTIADATKRADEKFGGRLVWDRDTDETRRAGIAVDQAMYDYVEGTASLDDVQKAWQAYVRALDSQYEAESQKGNLRLVL